VFLSAFASQRTDVPLCKRRTDFLYGSKKQAKAIASKSINKDLILLCCTYYTIRKETVS